MAFISHPSIASICDFTKSVGYATLDCMSWLLGNVPRALFLHNWNRLIVMHMCQIDPRTISPEEIGASQSVERSPTISLYQYSFRSGAVFYQCG